LLRHELTSGYPGSEAVVTRLADLLLAQAVRMSGADLDGFRASGRVALQDAQIATALRLMHDRSHHAWTIGELARCVAMSRSAFATRFKLLTGEAPMHYLTRYRLARAADRVRTSTDSLSEIALQTGYASDVALSKAFRRHFGMAPGAYRGAVQGGSNGVAAASNRTAPRPS
jgi:transcriptional regulator GlxA family with amidase domain